MDCKKAHTLLNEYLSEGLDPSTAAALEEHIYACASCKQLVEEWDHLRELLRTERRIIAQAVPEERLQRIYTDALAHVKRKPVPNFWIPIRDIVRSWWESPRFQWQLVRATTMLFLGIVIGFFAFQYLTPTSPVTSSLPMTAETDKPPTMIAEKTMQPGTAENGMIERVLSHMHPLGATPIKIDKNPYIEIADKGMEKPPLTIATPSPSPLDVASVSQPTKAIEASPAPQIPQEIQMVADEVQRSHLNNLQHVKLQLLLAGETESIQQIHQLEGDMIRLMSANTAQSSPRENWNYLTLYHEAEAALLRKDFMTALQKYYNVISAEPNSYLAFLSYYQVGIIQLEYLNNFGESLMAFQQCIQGFPNSYFSADQRRDIAERIALLNENAVDGWRPLRLYLQAKQNNLDVGLVLYRELLENYAHLKLSKRAAQHVVQDVLASQYDDSTIPVQVISMFQSSLEKISDISLRQQLQMGIADIMNYRMINRQQALLEYTRAIQIEPSSPMAMLARQRIKEIYSVRGARE